MKTTFVVKPLVVALATVLSGCAVPLSSFDANSSLRKEVFATAEQRALAPAVVAESSRVTETPGPFIPLTKRRASSNGWLEAIRVQMTVGKEAVPLSEVLRSLARQGVNVTSELPLDRFTYTGYSLNDVDAETALRMVLGTAGLDYSVDSERRMVVVKPLSSRTWYLNIGNRRTTYNAGGDGSAPVAASGGSDKGVGSQALNTPAVSTGSSRVTSSDDFWTSLKTELDQRMQVMLPEPPKAIAAPVAAAQLMLPPLLLPPVVPPAANPAGATGAVSALGTVASASGVPVAQTVQAMPSMPAPKPKLESGTLNYVSKKVGDFSLNPETGAVTVQAPHWVMQELDTYFKRIQDMYNTDMTFQGELILLTTDVQRSEGLDISSFARFAKDKYGFAYSNNPLGGVTISPPSKGAAAAIAAGQGALSGPLLGVTTLLNGLQVFNAYLTNMGRVSTLQRPILSTTSGTPADFRRTVTRYFNTVSQETSGGGAGSAAVGTKNQLISQDFGTILRVNPRIDVSTGLIRAQIELVQTTQAGTQTIPQSLTSGNTVQQINTLLPVVSKILYSGEALLRDGDLIVMGGQTEDGETMNRDGITGLMDSQVAGGIFGTAKKTAERNVFYFALRVTVNKR